MTSVLPVLLLVLLLLFPEVAVRGASDGLLLWYQTVLPTLLPFLICTRVIAGCGGLAVLMRPFAPLFHILFGLSQDGAYVLLCGLLCGYPLGAKLCADFAAEGRISSREARFLLAICNHPSPMFLTGYLRSILPLPVSAGFLFFCIYGPVLPLSLLARRVYRFLPPQKGNGIQRSVQTRPPQPFGSILLSGCETMVLIGCTMMLFSILSEWIRLIPGTDPRTQALLSGLAEITTGSRRICLIFPGRGALTAALTAVAFGGLSGLAQTQAVLHPASFSPAPSPDTENAGLSARHYVLWKLLHAACTTALATAVLRLSPAPPA